MQDYSQYRKSIQTSPMSRNRFTVDLRFFILVSFDNCALLMYNILIKCIEKG